MTPNQNNQKPQSFTADFIAEGLDQTRGRFRTLHILGHAIKGENAMKNVIVNGIILAEDGKKMAKSLKNYPDPQQLIEKRGGDSFRLHMLASPSVKAEPMRFNEKGTEQAFKDFTLPLQNVFNFFETYAKIDNWKSDGTEVRFMQTPFHKGGSDPAVLRGKQGDFVNERELIIRVNPDIIIEIQPWTTTEIQNIMQEYEHKKVEILTYNGQLERVEKYFDILQQQAGKRILIVGEKTDFENLRQQLYPETQKIPSTSRSTAEQREIIELPTYQLTNDLDKRILAELHKTIKEVDTHLQNYILDEATKSAMDFIDKLTNRRLRRSRRRFRSNGMNEDKHAAYATLYRVLRRYLQILAPFTPFITEYLRLALTPFRKGGSGEATGDFVDTKGGKQQSIHLSTRPIANDHYINETLIDEIATVRKIIKLALFIRAKNKIAVKQPLQKLEIKIN